MNKYVLAAALILSSPSFAGDVSSNLEGKYNCSGKELGTNTAFKCEMLIKKTGQTYLSTATCDDGNSYKGNGIYNQNSQHLSTGFINLKKAEETGVTVTEVKADGSLDTAWTYLNSSTIGHTQCVKQQA